MKKRIALILCIIMMVSVFSGCSLVIGGLAIVLPHLRPENPTQPTMPVDPWAEYECITIEEALALCGEPGNVTSERYYIRGTVASIDNATYGAMTVKDETGTISVYNSTDANDVSYAQMTEKPYKDDEVLLYCILQNHNGTKEVKQAQIIDFRSHEAIVDPSQYPYYTLDTARETEKGTKVQVEGVVAQITYANGKIPSGVMLVDHTGSIYIYDGDLAARVSIGNNISVLAEKDYWILDDEKSGAEKFGYQGCNQLTNAVLISNDKGNSDFDKSWIETTTVKDIMGTPVNVDISTKVFKVNALVKKEVNPGFVNYYFYDLDGKTGSYVYTQCNGGDFAWLDEFDGKICTVYLTALNAKSTASDCYWRLLPVKVIDENFDPATVNGAEHGVKYYGVGQFREKYTSDPALKLLDKVNAEPLGFEGITLSYTTSDPEVISIEEGVMHCLSTGVVTITVTGSYGGQTYSEMVEISVSIRDNSGTYPTVEDAISAEVGETVTVKGIVGPSLVNKVGFYLIDESGVIAVLVEKAETMAEIKIGNEVVLTAIRHNHTKGGATYYGQTCLMDAVVEANFYGEYEYPTDAFMGEISVEDFFNLDETKDYSTSVYIMKGTVVVQRSAYSVNVKLSDGTTEVSLYSGGKDDYAWLAEMEGEEVTVEIAACNWNDKTYYRGCVLSVIHADGTKTYNTLNFR